MLLRSNASLSLLEDRWVSERSELLRSLTASLRQLARQLVPGASPARYATRSLADGFARAAKDEGAPGLRLGVYE